MEVSAVRQRVKRVLAEAKRPEAERRAARRAINDQAAIEFDELLRHIAIPMFRQVADILRAEGCAVDLFTPGGSVRLMSERNLDDYIEVALDTSGAAPRLLGRASRSRGGNVAQTELVLNATADIAALTEEDLLGFLLSEIEGLV